MKEFGFNIIKFNQHVKIYYNQIDEYMNEKNIRGDLFHLSYEKDLKNDYDSLRDLMQNRDSLLSQRI